MTTNDGSMLTDTKKALGIVASNTDFDGEITMHLNSALSRLNQLGIGPIDGFEIVDIDEKWSDFMGTDLRFAPVKSFVYYYVRLLFDPPEIGYVLTAIKEQIDKLEWTLNVAREDRDHPMPITDAFPTDPDIEVILDGGGP